MKEYEITVTFVVEVPDGEVLEQHHIEQQVQDLLDQVPEHFHPENCKVREI